MRELVSTFGWQHVQDNIHLLPTVEQLTPSEWLMMLTTDERTAVASRFTRLANAASSVDGIDPDAKLTKESTAAIAEYVEATVHM